MDNQLTSKKEKLVLKMKVQLTAVGIMRLVYVER